MSQEYFPAGASAGEGSSRHAGRQSPDRDVPHEVPDYMVVGSGHTSEAARSLMTYLQDDSGYGGSTTGDPEWHAGLNQDRPTPSHTPVAPGQFNPAAERERQVVASHVHQLLYNSNRTQLSRAITRTIELLKDLQQMNRQWPAHYPSLPPTQPSSPDRRHVTRTWSLADANDHTPEIHRPESIRRAATSLGSGDDTASGSSPQTSRPLEPRLVTPQIAREFSILKLDLKLGAASQAELVHSLEKNSIASLLDGKVGQSIKHLLSLRDRIEDTASKVLITGDLNAGKSTFCNALLRRRILPEDQQPCTSIFCEVVDARENSGVEEVHAIHKDRVYDRNDEGTYDVYSLRDLEAIVVDNSKYMQCKVYVKDVRTIDESLLNNGVVDISLIDAPGLNSDSVKTTAVFARQEEIDVVVFVVSAANHFTLSAREFIMNAAHEKAYIFIVVNGFDNIRDRDRCRRMILEQVNALSPRTYKEAAELVHFVSSNAIPVSPVGGPGGDDGDGGSGGGGSDPSGDDDADEGKGKGKDKGKGKEKEKVQDFENLEVSLRRFVLEKRSRSKLAPARTYLLNILTDLNLLASVNRDVAASELDRVSQELDDLKPAYEESKKKRTEIAEALADSVEEAYKDVYDHTRSTLTTTISTVGDSGLGVDYPGLFSVFQYADDLKAAMLDEISACVSRCEDYARNKSVQGVNMIQSLGLLHVGEDKFPKLGFRPELMFKQRRHALGRQVDTQVDVWDFFDVSGIWERQEKVASTGMAMTVITVVGGRALGGAGWIDGVIGAIRVLGPNNVRRLLVPGILGAVALTATYVVSQIPNTLPTRLARKISATLEEMDYVHSNASRIATEVSRVLRMPASRLESTLQVATEELGKRKEEVGKVKQESEVARKYFTNLFRESNESRRSVERIDLEAPLPGAMSEYQQAH